MNDSHYQFFSNEQGIEYRFYSLFLNPYFIESVSFRIVKEMEYGMYLFLVPYFVKFIPFLISQK